MGVPYIITMILPIIIILISVIANPISRSKYTKDKYATVIKYKYKLLLGVILSIAYIVCGVLRYSEFIRDTKVFMLTGIVLILILLTFLTPNPALSGRELKLLKKEKK